MRVLKNLKLVIFVFITLSTIFFGCESRPDKNEEPFKVTPLHFDVYSNIVTICDILNLEDLKISPGDLFDYSIYLYVRPLNKTDWIRQGPAAAALRWIAQADLEAKSHRAPFSPISPIYIPIRDGEGFQIIAVLVKQSFSDKLPADIVSLGDLKKMEGVHIISEVRTAIFRRHK